MKNEIDNILVNDQFAAETQMQAQAFAGLVKPVAETPLHHAEFKSLAIKQAKSEYGIWLLEQNLTGLLTVRARENKTQVNAAISALLGIDLPDRLQCVSGQAALGEAATNATVSIRWMSPDEWLLSAPVEHLFWLETRLRERTVGKSVAFVNVSGGFTLLRVGGADLLLLLKKSTHYDVHPSHFTPGKTVNTLFAKSQVTMTCISENEVELIVRRSFADYIWLWLQDASREYGLRIDTPEVT